jgi:guanine nucleotide-binding protein subunit alpha
MHEAIMLFDSLCNSRWFINVPFILFLNKIDLFEQKVRLSPIKRYFPDYPGRNGDAEAGLKYFESIFLRLNRSNKPIYVHRTCATDTQSMKFVLSAVTDMIVQQNLKKSGLL